LQTKGLRPAAPVDCPILVAAAFAHLLLGLGRHEPIRAIEAIAAAIANGVDQSSCCLADTEWTATDAVRTRHERFAQRLAALAVPIDTSVGAEENPAFASCLRIARRAMASAISDPTGGATRFHSYDEAPQWARGMLPCASIGGFLFYRDDQALLIPEASRGD
jgi:Cell Wall Hydrolase.